MVLSWWLSLNHDNHRLLHTLKVIVTPEPRCCRGGDQVEHPTRRCIGEEVLAAAAAAASAGPCSHLQRFAESYLQNPARSQEQAHMGKKRKKRKIWTGTLKVVSNNQLSLSKYFSSINFKGEIIWW